MKKAYLHKLLMDLRKSLNKMDKARNSLVTYRLNSRTKARSHCPGALPAIGESHVNNIGKVDNISKIGKVARCEKGFIGLIYAVAPREKPFKPIYMGVCLDPGRAGQAWLSVEPKWIGTPDDWVKLRHVEIAKKAFEENTQ